MDSFDDAGLGHRPTDEDSGSSPESENDYEGRPSGRAERMMADIIDNQRIDPELLQQIGAGKDAPSNERGDLCNALAVGLQRLFEDDRLEGEVYRTHCAHLQDAYNGIGSRNYTRSIGELRRLFSQLCVSVVKILEVVEREIGHVQQQEDDDDDDETENDDDDDLLMGASPQNVSSIIATYAPTDLVEETLEETLEESLL
jgi:hypothetical protein